MKEKNKIVSMETKAKEPEKKLSYEELEKICNSLNQQCHTLHQRCMAAENALASFNEVEMLLNVMTKSIYFPESFMERCSKTVEKIITQALDAVDAQEAAESKTE